MKEQKEIPVKVRRHNRRKLPLPSVTITQMSQICAVPPPHCAAELSPCTPLGVRQDGLITRFAGAVRRHNAGLKEQDRDKDVHNWTLSLEPGTSRRHAGSYSSIFILIAKQRRLICLGLGFLFNSFTFEIPVFFGGGTFSLLFFFFFSYFVLFSVSRSDFKLHLCFPFFPQCHISAFV